MKFIILVLALFAGNAWASDEEGDRSAKLNFENEVVKLQFIPVDDFDKCKWRNGKKILKSTCADLKDEIEYFGQISAKFKDVTRTDEMHLHHQVEMLKQIHQYLTDITDRRFKLSSRKPDSYDNCTEFRPAVAGERVEVPCDPDNKTAFELDQEKEEAAQKRKCGKDYQTIRIGMSINRLHECNGATFVTKTVSADGVIETYRTMFDFVDVKNGKIISYTKRRY